MLVSIIIPAYNAESTIGKAIENVLSQSDLDTEIIVVDDGSTDGTPQILERYENSIRVIRQSNAGAAAARNAGVAATKGEYLAFLDADDLWLPGRLSRTLAALQDSPQAVLSFCDYLLVDKCGKVLHRNFVGRAPSHRDLLQGGCPILPSAVTIRRTAYESVGGFNEHLRAGEDPYLWLVLSERGSFQYVPEQLVLYRYGSAATAFVKYEPSRRTFERLVKARYGSKADGMLRHSDGYFGSLALAGALEEFDQQNFARAATLLRSAISYRAILLFNPKLLAKLFRAHNLRRLAKLFSRSPWRTTS
jgi:glycosyltransferase involved in cell wall biosynthesis